jgi:hypothetical protein
MPGLNNRYGTATSCLASESMSLTNPFSFARPPLARKHISRSALLEILEAALDLVSDEEEDDDTFIVTEKSSSMKENDDPESAQ